MKLGNFFPILHTLVQNLRKFSEILRNHVIAGLQLLETLFENCCTQIFLRNFEASQVTIWIIVFYKQFFFANYEIFRIVTFCQFHKLA